MMGLPLSQQVFLPGKKAAQLICPGQKGLIFRGAFIDIPGKHTEIGIDDPCPGQKGEDRVFKKETQHKGQDRRAHNGPAQVIHPVSSLHEPHKFFSQNKSLLFENTGTACPQASAGVVIKLMIALWKIKSINCRLKIYKIITGRIPIKDWFRGGRSVIMEGSERGNMEVTDMQELTKLIREDMKPALGVTEPGAIAFAVATAREHLERPEEIETIEVALNSGMYKNAFTCGIPNSSRYGNLYAAALGAVAAKAEKGLESLADIMPEDDEKAARLVEEGRVKAWMSQVDSRISIDATVKTATETCTVEIRDSHTHIVRICKDGKDIFREDQAAEETEGGQEKEEIPVIHRYSFHEILEYVRNVPESEISFIREAFSMNMDLLEEGIHSGRAVIAEQLLRENDHHIISEDARKTAQLLCNGAIEARVLGLGRPAMSITGSGSHGIIATMPLFAFYEVNYEVVDDDLLLRATALSYLITMYIKEYSGKLSAFCGCGIAAGTGMACGLAYMRGAGEKELAMVIQNMASGITGMICDGGNHGCAMKGIVAVDAAFRSVDLAMEGVCIEEIHGINGKTPEDTMRNMGLIASPGMVQTEKTIVDIMEQK